MLRGLRRFFTSLITLLASSVVAVAIFIVQWRIFWAGDGALGVTVNSALLIFEALLLLFALAIVELLVRRAIKLALKVGTVRIGSPEEKQADRVLWHFDLVTTSVIFFWGTFWLPAFAAFFLLEPQWPIYLHGTLLVMAIIGTNWQEHRLERVRQACGYSEGFGRLTP
ncbi:hypothetical protein [Vagococcus sp. WN89Y]|uniref:hypothetical protein n=1 Tax=Vagococcus sp. WN89Y TaxID=3457258 RepID=UPI003FCEA0AB